MTGIPWGSLASIGPWGLVTVAVLCIFFGVLVPGREVRYWRQAFFTEQKMRQDLEATGRVVRTVIESLPDPPSEGP